LPVNYNPNGPILLLPGSRKIAVKKIFPIMLNSVNQLKKFGEMCELIVVYPDEDILVILQNIYKKYKNLSLSFVRSGTCTFPARASLMSSGTMALNCALAGIPSVIVCEGEVFTYGKYFFKSRIGTGIFTIFGKTKINLPCTARLFE
jgi:lipid-A-disaccharide synthase